MPPTIDEIVHAVPHRRNPRPRHRRDRRPRSVASPNCSKQVSDPTRLQVLMLLSERERNVTELCSDLGTQSQPAVSHHLALLRHGRLIEPRRSGKHNFYALTDAGRQLAACRQFGRELTRSTRAWPPCKGAVARDAVFLSPASKGRRHSHFCLAAAFGRALMFARISRR